MISYLKNQSDYIYAYAEWRVVNKDGQIETDGDYIYIVDLWIHPYRSGRKTLKHLIQRIDTHPAGYTAKWVYWKSQKHKDRLTPSYSRKRLRKIGVKNESVSKAIPVQV